METPPQFYKIQDLVLLPELNPRAQLCEETIIRYMESFEALPPVSIQEGTGVLVDGFHRVEAAVRLGAEVLPVRMLDIADEELHLYAGLGNCGHGRALHRDERNRFILRLVEEYGWPADKIARVVGVSVSSVNLAIREHRYNRELSERLGQGVQVVNSAHVQALYRVGDEQRSRLLDAVATKTDADGLPQPLTGAELKCLVDRMEDPATPAAELRRLLEDPLARPEAPARRRPAPAEPPTGEPEATTSAVERRGPLYAAAGETATDGSQRTELLRRAFASDDEEQQPSRASRRDDSRSPFTDEDIPVDRDSTQRWHVDDEPWSEAVIASEPPAGDRPAPLGLDRPGAWSEAPTPRSITVERDSTERGPADALQEAERLLGSLCLLLEDADAWEQARSARDLVREALQLLGRPIAERV